MHFPDTTPWLLLSGGGEGTYNGTLNQELHKVSGRRIGGVDCTSYLNKLLDRIGVSQTKIESSKLPPQPLALIQHKRIQAPGV